MKTKLNSRGWLFTATVVFAAMLCFVPRPSFASGKSFVVEVCERGIRFVPDLDPDGNPEPFVTIDGLNLPGYGNEFITEGFLFPKGTLKVGKPCVDAQGNPVPELKDLVIGTWTCRGWHVGNASAAEAGTPAVISTQNFVFGDQLTSRQIIVTNGFEAGLADVNNNVPVTRPIIGASGRLKKFSGGVSVQRAFDVFPYEQEELDEYSDIPLGFKLRVKFRSSHKFQRFFRHDNKNIFNDDDFGEEEDNDED